MHDEPCAVILRMQLDAHFPVVASVLARVVENRRDQAAQALDRSLHGDALVHVTFQLDGALEGHRFELQKLAFHQVRQVDALFRLRFHDVGLLGVEACEEQQVGHEPLHALAFRLRAFDPLALACDGALGVRHEDRRVREDDGERGLQLMRGVGHELPLLLPRTLYRAQGPAREEYADHEEDGERDRADGREGERKGLPSVRRADIGKRDARDAGVGGVLLVKKAQFGKLA